MTKKYEFTGEEMNYYGHVLKRIRALRDFGNVKTGDIGGWIEDEESLSHAGNCWVHDDAKVFGGGTLQENAKIYDSVEVYEYAKLTGCVAVRGRIDVCEYALLRRDNDIFTVTVVGSITETTTAYRTKYGELAIHYSDDGFTGTIDEFSCRYLYSGVARRIKQEHDALIKFLKNRFDISS